MKLLFVRIFYLLCCILNVVFAITEYNKGCKFRDVERATFQKCYTSDDRILPMDVVLWEDIPVYTICEFKCNSGKTVSHMCEDGTWTGPRCKYVRVKRFWRRRRRSPPPPPPPPPDTTPPTISCPGDIWVSAGKMQTSAVATWSEPTAYDSKDGTVGTSRSGPSPGSSFSEGSTTITYHASDRSGNRASCSFRVHVTVARCSPPTYSGGHFSCTGGGSYLYGSVCNFDCSAVGYELVGSSQTECFSSGQWNRGIPSCQKVICGDPGGLMNGQVSMTGTRYGDSVTYTCDTNYNITGDITRSCQANRVWTGAKPTCWYVSSCSSSPCLNGATCTNTLGSYTCTCKPGWAGINCQKDIQPPVMSGCQSSELFRTSQPKGEVSWNIPTFSDPMGNLIQVSSNYPTNSTSFPWGDFVIQYSALKPSNGERTECNFTISVKPHECNPIKVPANAAVLCNDWDTDILDLCIIACKSGYSVPRGFSDDEVYICGSKGEWSPTGPLPECLANTKTNSAMRSPPFSDCSLPSVQQQLSSHYINTINASKFAHICKTHSCDVNRVSVRC